MEHFDDLLKKKVEGKTHDFHFSNWKSFCAKAGINPFFASLKMLTIASVSVATVSIIVTSVVLFTPRNQSVSVATPEDSAQIISIDTGNTIDLPDFVEINAPATEELAAVVTPVRKTENLNHNPAKDEDEIVPIVEQKVAAPPKRIENIRGSGMKIDTIKSDNQLMEW